MLVAVGNNWTLFGPWQRNASSINHLTLTPKSLNAQWVNLHTGGFEKANGEENKTHVRCEPELLPTCLALAPPWAMESRKQNGKHGSGDDQSKLSLRNQLYNVCVLTEWCSWRGVWQVLQHVALCTPSICL